MKLNKMQIIVVDAKGEFDNPSLVEKKEVLFNPTKMSYSKSVSWSDAGVRGGNIKKKQYDRIGDHTLSVELLFDFTRLGHKDFKEWFVYFKALSSESVKGDIKDTKRPPVLSISWGESSFIHFSSCVISAIAWDYELFDKKGNVLRAIAKITFEEICRVKEKKAPAVKKVTSSAVETVNKIDDLIKEFKAQNKNK